MKILLIQLMEEKNNLSWLHLMLEEINIEMDIFSLKSREDMDIEQFKGFFDKDKNEPPEFVIILSSLSKSWFDFLAGFSCGSQLPLLVYSQEAISGISQELSSFFTFINNEASLKTYLEATLEAHKKQEAAREIIKAQEKLLAMGVSVNGESLALCISEGRLEEVALFLAAGFSPDTRNKEGVPLLNIAARNGRREIVKYLLMADAEVNNQAEDRGTTALIDSVMRKQYDIMADLIKAGTDLNIQSRDGQTALIVAVGIGDEKPVEALLKAGSDPDIEDSMGTSARQYAALFNKDKLGKFFDDLTPGEKNSNGP